MNSKMKAFLMPGRGYAVNRLLKLLSPFMVDDRGALGLVFRTALGRGCHSIVVRTQAGKSNPPPSGRSPTRPIV